jgi:hypothetical protein
MTTYAFPSVTPTSSRIQLLSNTDRFISPISGAVQTIDRGGERWVLDLVYRNLTDAETATMSAFLAKLNGQQHRFTLHNHAENNQGAFGGTPLVDGADQTGVTLDIDGCSISITDWMKEGDWFGVNSELKIATADANSDGAGDATLTFAPRLRSAPADDAAITTASATGVFMLADNGVSWNNKPGGFHDLTIQAFEDIAA